MVMKATTLLNSRDIGALGR
ncbi:uncharacterized protein FTOL_13338 [Fusarium torulosum]|uniref:Uncharacterized protein n=1 Tax=Fusarium torulosum TaxID=33205 RepID=A0AAE8SQ29_9HYPO|nr:uncharacterized protein FTOL_13338 [Fusarium torulosum]